MSKAVDDKPIEYDPVFLHARREAIVIFCFWLVALVWSVPYCYFYGYAEEVDAATFSTVMGIPSWLFWGIGLPWLAADVATTWFCFAFMKDDDLGHAADEAPLDEASKADSPSGGEEG